MAFPQQDPSGCVSLLHLSDLHLEATSIVNASKRDFAFSHFETRFKEELGRKKIDLVLVTGDLVDFPKGSDEHSSALLIAKHYLEQFASEHCTNGTKGLVVIPGNHDSRWKGVFASEPAHQIFRDIFAPYFCHKLFEFEKLDIVVGCFDSNKSSEAVDFARGVIDPKELDSELETLYKMVTKPDRTLKIGMIHHHPLPVPEAERTQLATVLEKVLGKVIDGASEYMVLKNAGTFLQRLLNHDFRLVLHGHLHEKGYWRASAQDFEGEEKWIEVIAGGSVLQGLRPGFNHISVRPDLTVTASHHSWNREGTAFKPISLPTTPYETVRVRGRGFNAEPTVASKRYAQSWYVDLEKGDLQTIEHSIGYHALKSPQKELTITTSAECLTVTGFTVKQLAGEVTVEQKSPSVNPQRANSVDYSISFQPDLGPKDSVDLICEYSYPGTMYRSAEDKRLAGKQDNPSQDEISQTIIRPVDRMTIMLKFRPDSRQQPPWVPDVVTFHVFNADGVEVVEERDGAHASFEYWGPKRKGVPSPQGSGATESDGTAFLTVYKPRVGFKYLLRWNLQEREVVMDVKLERHRKSLLQSKASNTSRQRNAVFLEACMTGLVKHLGNHDTEDIVAYLYAYDKASNELTCVATTGEETTTLYKTRFLYGRDVIGTSFRRREPLVFIKADKRFEFFRRLTTSDEFHFIVALPVTFKSLPIGVLALASSNEVSRLDEVARDATCLQNLSEQFSSLYLL